MKTMKNTIMTVLAFAGISAFASASYEWKMTADPLIDPTTQDPMVGFTVYLIDADVVDQQSVLTAVIGNGTALETYLAGVSGAKLASAVTSDEGYIPATAFSAPSQGTDGHAFFAVYGEALQALYFSGYSTVRPNGAGTPTLVSNAYSSQLPINYTTTFQGSMTAGDGGGWYAGVPEPTSGVMLAFGLALLGLKRKRG